MCLLVSWLKVVKSVWLVKLVSVHFFHIWTSKKGAKPSFFTLDLEMCFAPQRRASTSQLSKVVWDRGFLTLLTWKCASRHNGAQFFDISTSKSGPNVRCCYLFYLQMCIGTSKSGPRLVCFVHFDLEMCFAPQRRALFRHLNFQKWSENGVFCTFWLGNVHRATTACNFSWPAGSAPAALARLLFDPPGPQIIGKTQWIATFLPFRAPASSCFPRCLFSDLLTSWLLPLALPTSAFPSLHIVGSLT